MDKKPRSCTYRIGLALLSLLGLCLIFTIVSVFSNRNLPGEEGSSTLNEVDKARLLESLHLKETLGDQVWQGWGNADIPVIVWNRSYEFLVNYDGSTPAGWSRITEDDFSGQTYFSRIADNPQNFAVRVGDTWIASIANKNTTDVFLINMFQETLPTPVKQIFPYRFLLQPSETQMGGLLHETFHVYQYQLAPERMAEAESIHRLGDEYELAAESFNSEWRKEAALLAEALNAETKDEKADFVHQFLELRDARREDYKLEDQLVDYELWLEWEEGTAKYIEMAILRMANETIDYQPVPGMEEDPDFKHYQGIGQRWSQELFQLRYQTSPGESRFYATGMAQAFLLDDLTPDWKEQYWMDDIFLEDLLRTAVGS
jgi:hypothetical protein